MDRQHFLSWYKHALSISIVFYNRGDCLHLPPQYIYSLTHGLGLGLAATVVPVPLEVVEVEVAGIASTLETCSTTFSLAI
jgi:hypothetical protein